MYHYVVYMWHRGDIILCCAETSWTGGGCSVIYIYIRIYRFSRTRPKNVPLDMSITVTKRR